MAVFGCTDSDFAAPAFLADLQITGTKTGLNPSFDPKVFRYSVIANDDLREVSIRTLVLQRAVVTINGNIAGANSAYSLAMITPGDVIEIEVHASRGTMPATRYQILYLPADFPELVVTTFEPEASTDPLYVTMNTDAGKYVAILDNRGVPFYYKAETSPVFDFKWHSASGERSYLRFTGETNEWGRWNGEAVVLDSDYDEVERITTVGLGNTDIHDFQITPNGEAILIAYQGTLRDLRYLNLTAEEVVEESVIQVLDRATRQVMFQWNSLEQVPFEDQTYPAFRSEYAHVNSVIEDYDGNLIISASGTSQAIKIARPGGQVVWKLGGKSNQFEIFNDPLQSFCGQHDVSRLDNGHLLVFDNGRNCWQQDPDRGALTRVIEYRLDESTLEAELVWSYTQSGAFSTSQGSAQRLTNGNTLIGWGNGPGILATEVAPEGKTVFEIIARDGNRLIGSYRARRYPR